LFGPRRAIASNARFRLWHATSPAHPYPPEAIGRILQPAHHRVRAAALWPAGLNATRRHQIEALVKAGVKDVVLAVNYRPEVMVALLSKLEEQYDIKITFSVESEPLGTGLPFRFFRVA
jgi:hypothetical protein